LDWNYLSTVPVFLLLMISQNITYRWLPNGHGILKHDSNEFHGAGSSVLMAAITGRPGNSPVA
jgi:hypothetical protein